MEKELLNLIIVAVVLVVFIVLLVIFRKREKQPKDDLGNPLMIKVKTKDGKEFEREADPIIELHRAEFLIALAVAGLIAYYVTIILTVYPRFIALESPFLTSFVFPILLTFPAVFVLVAYLVLKYLPVNDFKENLVRMKAKGERKMFYSEADFYVDDELRLRMRTDSLLEAINDQNPIAHLSENYDVNSFSANVLGSEKEKILNLEDFTITKGYKKLPVEEYHQYLVGGDAIIEGYLQSKDAEEQIEVETLAKKVQELQEKNLELRKEITSLSTNFEGKVLETAYALTTILFASAKERLKWRKEKKDPKTPEDNLQEEGATA